MPRRIAADWVKIRTEYQAGVGTCPELARKYGISVGAVARRCQREKWASGCPKVVQSVQSVVQRKVEMDMVDEAKKWIRNTIKRADRIRGDIDAAREQFGEDPQGRVVMDILNIKSMTSAEREADALARKSLGLADTTIEAKSEVSGQVTVLFDDAARAEMREAWKVLRGNLTKHEVEA